MTEGPTGWNRRLIRGLQLAFIVGAAGLAYSFVASARDGELRKSCTSLCTLAPAYADANRVAPDFQFNAIDGTSRRLSDLRGKTVVLVFWSTSCDVCKKQMPALAQLATMMRHDRRLEMLTVTVDDSLSDVIATLEEHTGAENPFPVMLDPDARVVTDQFGTKAFPETWVIDGEGIIRARFDGARDWSSSLATDMLRNVARGSACPMSVKSFVARGPGAQVCRDVSL